MSPVSQNRQSVIDQMTTLRYMPGYLADVLLLYQAKRATGIARIKALAEDRIFHRVIVFRAGLIVYAGPTIPTPYEFIIEMAEWTHIAAVSAVLKFAAQRSSIQGVVRTLVENGVLRWPEIAKATQARASLVLEELISTTGQVCFESDLSTFDLHYGGGTNGSTIHNLLLERTLHGHE